MARRARTRRDTPGLRTASLASLTLLCLGAPCPAEASSFTTLHHFAGAGDCFGPNGGLAYFNGRYYGTCAGGKLGFGAIFWLNGSGQYKIIYSFKNMPDGYDPNGNLVRVPGVGGFFGTTRGGGANATGGGGYGGTVFHVTPTGVETVLHSFTPLAGQYDGFSPVAGLTVRNGQLFGQTSYGGTYADGAAHNFGTLFTMSPQGYFSTLFDFDVTQSGAAPMSTLLNSNGVLYGTTSASLGGGTIFSITPSAGGNPGYQLLSSLAGPANPALPQGSLVRLGNYLYGASLKGGAQGFGTIFRYSLLTGSVQIIYAFTNGADGSYPEGGLATDPSGAIYGTAAGGGSLGYGTLFKITTAGQFTLLHDFTGPDGAFPRGDLTVLKATATSPLHVVGVTYQGGANCPVIYYACGTVFDYSP